MTKTTDLTSSTDYRKMCTTHAATQPEPHEFVENSNVDAQPSEQEKRKPRISRSARKELDEFFEATPGAALSIENTAMKLQVAPHVARRYLGALVGEGELERVSFYRRKAKE